jgi:hypothetical protein
MRIATKFPKRTQPTSHSAQEHLQSIACSLGITWAGVNTLAPGRYGPLQAWTIARIVLEYAKTEEASISIPPLSSDGPT